MSIVVLDEATASKIAAGEVIERPASVVKELVENALDANASEVDVEIREAGRGLIRVTDDGEGMTRQDAVLSLQRYATSKVRGPEDLFAIRTLGFRGEALPSVAAISHLTMVTRVAAEDAGTRLVAVGGEVTELEDVGTRVGTQLSVSRLFYNTPARLKFLRRDATESGHIADVCTRFLFSHPDVALHLRAQGRDLIHHGGLPDLRSAVVAAWGKELAEHMTPVELSAGGLTVRGLASGPSFHRASRNRQSLFVNRRWVRSRRLSHALEEAYRGVLPAGRYPAAVLLLEVDPGAVDVNVHPTKSEVRLHAEQEAYHVVLRAVREALARARAPSAVDLTTAAPGPQGAAAEQPHALPIGASSTAGWAGTIAAPGVLSPAFQVETGEKLELRPLAHLRQTYILAESRQGLLVVDQHRAQERILYERLAEAWLSETGESQVLLEPASVQLGPREAAALEDQTEELRRVGFELEPFGRDTYLVRGVPAHLRAEDAAALVRDVAEELAAEVGEKAVNRRRERLLITLSCRSAVKAGDALSYEEMVQLLQDLSGTARPYTCPHGWPIVMTISNFEIDRKYRRGRSAGRSAGGRDRLRGLHAGLPGDGHWHR